MHANNGDGKTKARFQLESGLFCLIMSVAQMGLILCKVSEGRGITKGQWALVMDG
jgi:hypothetical protein